MENVFSPSGETIAADRKKDTDGSELIWLRVEAGPELKAQLDHIEALLVDLLAQQKT